MLKHLDTRYACRNLTHLCIFNNGSINSVYGLKNIPRVKQEVFARSEIVAKELNLPILKLESNFQDVVPQSHLRTHTYMDALAIYALQKLWRVYYYGSTYSFRAFTLNKNMTTDPAHLELLLLDCFSTSQLKIISSGSEGDRNDKINFIADKPIAQKYLHVCLKRGERNCGRCDKCLRTLIALDAINKLDDFRESFDIDDYLKIRNYAYIYMHDKIARKDGAFYLESYQILYKRHKEFFDSITPETERLFKI